jgi:hypothetical protein
MKSIKVEIFLFNFYDISIDSNLNNWISLENLNFVCIDLIRIDDRC